MDNKKPAEAGFLYYILLNELSNICYAEHTEERIRLCS